MIKGLIIPQEDHHQQQQPVVLMEENMSNLTSASGDQTRHVSSGANINRAEIDGGGGGGIYHPHQYYYFPPPHQTDQPPPKKKRNLPGNPDPDAEVIALSPKTLMATNRFVCEICNKGFQRDQNLQLHRRGHNLPWKLKQRNIKEVVRKKVYVCPEASCVHHEASRALGDLTGIKKHFCRKHGEKKWKCDKCTKRYAVQSDWKAHSKTCGTREYRCDCGTLFSRRDSFITHRAFCDALAEESARSLATGNGSSTPTIIPPHLPFLQPELFNNIMTHDFHAFPMKKEQQNYTTSQTPPWRAAGAGQDGPQPQTIPLNMDHHHDLTSSYHDQEFTMQHDDDDDDGNSYSNPNPNPHPNTSTSVGPNNQLLPAYMSRGGSSSSSSPHMSATALLQKAAQMGSTLSTCKTSTTTAGSSSLVLPTTTTTMIMTRPHQGDHMPSNTAGFDLNLSSREQELATGFLASFGNKAAALSGSVSPAGAGVPPPSSCFIDQDILMMMMMMMSSSSSRSSTCLSSAATRASGFDHQQQAMATSTFEDYGLTTTGFLMDSKKHDDHHHNAHIGEAAHDMMV